ncbi:hypothetical protein EVA_03737 [gut metagenome]|uniref:Uncharacterized protein n=1 Tax=gut metagenome TaxID=749906 RepID=J9GK67_9ZZZZ
MQDTKQCTRCKKIKPLSQFYIRENGKPRNYCKSCEIQRIKAYTNKKQTATKSKHKKVKSPCRECARFLTPKCDQQLWLLIGADRECQFFSERKATSTPR